MKLTITIAGGVALTVYCPTCKGERSATKAAERAAGGAGRPLRWFNTCCACGTAYYSLPPQAGSGRRQVRRVRRRRGVLERAGQRRLFA